MVVTMGIGMAGGSCLSGRSAALGTRKLELEERRREEGGKRHVGIRALKILKPGWQIENPRAM